MSGTALAQLIALLLSFVITRLYSPDDFATLEQFAMLLAIFGVFVTGKYEFAIMLPKDGERARHLAVLAIRISALLSAIVFVGSLLFSSQIAGLLNNPEMETAILFLGPVLLLFGITNTLTFWFNRQKQFKVNATGKVIFTLISDPVKLLTSTFGASGVFLVISVTMGHLVTSGYLLWKISGVKKFFEADKALLKEVRKEHSDYPRFTVPGSLLNRLAQWVHIAVFSAFFGLWAIGFLALARRVVMLPLSILSSSFSQVYYQRISEIEDPRELRSHYLRFLWKFALLGAAIIGIVWVLPDNTMGWLFGEEWTKVMSFLRILVFWFAANFTVGALGFVNHRLRRQRLMFALDLTHFIVVLVGITIAWYFNMDELDALVALVISKVIYFAIAVIATIVALNQNIGNLEKKHE
jgi:O-antigen/teichoic acid export membrane protein